MIAHAETQSTSRICKNVAVVFTEEPNTLGLNLKQSALSTTSKFWASQNEVPLAYASPVQKKKKICMGASYTQKGLVDHWLILCQI